MSFMDKTKTTNKTAENITYGTKTADSTSKTFNLNEQCSVTGTYGWICPVCGRGVAPDQQYCGCRLLPVHVVYPYPSYPVYPYWWHQVTCGTIGSTSTSDLSNSKTTYTTTGISTKVEG